jgi:hypothetical protein
MQRFFKSALTASLLAAIAWTATGSDATAQVVPNETGALEQPSAQASINAFLNAHPNTFVSVRGGTLTRVYGKAFSSGTSPIDSADGFVAKAADMYGLAPEHLAPIGPFADGTRVLPLVYDRMTESYKFSLVTYSQYLNGLPVFRADLRVLVRNEPGFPAVLATGTLRDLGEFAATFNGGPMSPSQVDQKTMLRNARLQFREEPVISAVEPVIWAGVDESPEAPKLAYKFVAQGGLALQPENYQKWLYVVDASNGRILFQENQICEFDVSGKVTGVATEGTGADICANESVVGLPYAKVTVGGVTTFADFDGNYVATGVPAGTTVATSSIEGLYFVTNDLATSVSFIETPINGGVADFVHNADNSSALVRAQVNAYYHANVIRDLVLEANPNYPVIAGQTAFQINTNIASTCNAFYDGNSINFYQSGGGCSNTAFATVVHHEFGHHVVNTGGSGQGAYGEGMSDCMGILVTDESITGLGFQNNCAAGIRNADNDCLYQASGCSSCGSAIHSCGRLLSGCVWDLRTNWAAIYPNDYLDRLRSIVVNSVPLHGNTTSIAPDITIDFLTLDDDNADINDGTPNYASIADAFGQHDMPAPPIQLLKFTYPNGVPTSVNPNGTTTLSVEVSGIAGTPQPGTGTFFYRTAASGPFTSVPMTQGAANTYSVTIPSSTCLSTVQFYIQAAATNGNTQTNPSGAPSAFFSAVSAASTDSIFADEMELSSAGWQAGVPGDTAGTGLWVRVDPNGTAAQPENDNTVAGTQAWITGQGSPGGALGEADIDGGETTLVSPTFDATGFDAAYVTYYRWYSNNTGASPNADSMPVEISNNNGSTWTLLENVTENANAWVFKSFKISDFVVPTATMKLRWRASDLGSGSLVEAGVDDVSIVGFVCTVANPADLDGDGDVDAADLGILLGAWGTNGPGDIDGDGTVGAADLALLLGSF